MDTHSVSIAFALPASSGAGNNYTFLFQGDSITDGNRIRDMDWNHVLGHGYAYLIAARLWFEFPKNGFHFFNRGISGNSVPDLASILVGVNDTTHAVYPL